MSEAPRPATPAHLRDAALAGGLLALTALVFWPALRWIATQTFAHEQLQQSFSVLLLAGLWIAWDKRDRLRLRLQLTNAALAWLTAACLCAAGAVLLRQPLLVLAGLVAAAGGAVHCLLGPEAGRRATPLLAGFGVFLLLILALPLLDWPLRRMAGIESARLLASLGFAPRLALTSPPDVQLLLAVGGRVFVVAPECNGFGLISSSLLLGLLFLLYRRARWWELLLLLPGAVTTGFVFNLLRIFAIITLAPHFPRHYMVLHEVAGLAALYSGLAVVWWITTLPDRRPANAAAPA